MHARAGRSLPWWRSKGKRGCRGGFGELCRIVQLKVTEDLVGGDVGGSECRAYGLLPAGESTDEVSVDERFGVRQRIVVVRFRSVVDNSVCLADQFVSQPAVGNIAYDELEAGFREDLQKTRRLRRRSSYLAQ